MRSAGVSAGLSYINLRGMGASRTLTLPRRAPRRAFDPYRAQLRHRGRFPTCSAERVDASTIGGNRLVRLTDAVSGVVNFVLDTNFTGPRPSAGRCPELGDNQNYEAELGWEAARWAIKRYILPPWTTSPDGIVGYHDRDWFNSCALIWCPPAHRGRAVRCTRVTSIRPASRSERPTTTGSLRA